MTPLVEIDPFDLPEWLGAGPVTWQAEHGVREGHLVRGTLSDGTHEHPCDLLAVDLAYPQPVVDDAGRARAHQVWEHRQVHLTSVGDRLTLAVPGTRFSADLILEVVHRLAKALGNPPEQMSVLLRLGH